MPRLKDVLPPHPRLLLVGINPGLRSGALGHHFAGNGNLFWRLLSRAGLTPDPGRWCRAQVSEVWSRNICPSALTRTPWNFFEWPDR